MSPRLPAAAGPIAPNASGSPVIKGLSDLVSDTGPRDGEVPSEYAMPMGPLDGPDIVVEPFRPDDATAVVPHPRYPDEPSSRISNGPS
jgi:hypothetical protein